MATYKYTGADERIPAPPLQGDLVPGETVESAEPVVHPDLEPADEDTRKATEALAEEFDTALEGGPEPSGGLQGDLIPVAEQPAPQVEDTPRPRARARAKE